jgi:hypothetical protein
MTNPYASLLDGQSPIQPTVQYGNGTVALTLQSILDHKVIALDL